MTEPSLSGHDEEEAEGLDLPKLAERIAEPKEKKSPGYPLCELCNFVLDSGESVEAHRHNEHAELESLFSFTFTPRCSAIPLDTRSTAQRSESALTLGRYMLGDVRRADGGKEMFEMIQRARAQLDAMLAGSSIVSVLLFGSCVTMGIWDGVGDGDFTILSSKVVSTGQLLSMSNERRLLQQVVRGLRRGGLQFNELEVLLHTRTPVIKRCRETSVPYDLQSEKDSYSILFVFESPAQCHNFDSNSIENVHFGKRTESKRESKKLRFFFDNGAAAMHVFKRNEKVPSVKKIWDIKARVPEIFGLDFDVSCRPLGVRNSWLLRRYMEQSPVFRAGSVFIKYWSKAAQVNNSRQGYLTSYAMNVLWVYYLLRCGQATFEDPSSIGLVPTLEMRNVEYMPLWPTSMDNAKTRLLGELMQGFFRFYAYELDWSTEVVSLCTNPLVHITMRAEIEWEMDLGVDSTVMSARTFYGMSILDIYENNLNLGRHLSPIKQHFVHTQFVRAYECCGDVARYPDLLRNVSRHAEETLRVELHRHLAVSGGASTVASIRAKLAQVGNGEPLASYLMRHSLSGLWCDEQLLARANTLLKRSGRAAVPVPNVAQLVRSAWIAISDNRRFPPASADTTDVVVYLARNGINYSDVPQEVTQDEKERLKQVMSVLWEEYEGVARVLSVTMGTLCSSCSDPLADIRFLFFATAGGHLFNSFDAREKFEHHLRLIAASRVGRTTADALLAAICDQEKGHGSQVDENILRGILNSVDYVVAHDTGLRFTALLREYNAEDKVLSVQRISRRPRTHHREPQKQGRSTINETAGMIGYCDQCGTKNVKVFGANETKLDNGRYCLPCWKNY